MNANIFRLVFSKHQGMLIPVAEHATVQHKTARGARAGHAGRGKPVGFLLKSLALGVAAVLSAPTFALPTAPAVVGGQAGFAQQGNLLTVTNSNGAMINWQSFNIAARETVRFEQPSASSAVLNRVLGNNPSAIYGQLSSNGKVWLINPSGILVGPGGVIDTAGFVASTLNVRAEDFLAGKLAFQATPGAGDVINKGRVTTPLGGSVYLVGSNVSNEGLISTPGGETILAAGQTVSLVDTATPGVKVEITGAEGNATNLGNIVAEAGRIGIAGGIVRNAGTLNAASVVEDGGRIFLKATRNLTVESSGLLAVQGSQGGTVELDAGDSTIVRGRIDASGIRRTGGRVDILGDKVGLFDLAFVDASGISGGGSIRIGGDYQGANAAVHNARFTYLGPTVQIRADAQDRGQGGRVIVWADDTTRAYGSISATGGVSGGKGGFVEVSGKRALDFTAAVRVGARSAGSEAGTLLLDPGMLWIANFGGTIAAIGDPGYSAFAPITGNIATISPAALAAVGGNVTLYATEELFIDDPITLTTVGAGLTASAGKLLVVTPGSTITTHGGAVSLTSNLGAGSTYGFTFPVTGTSACTASYCTTTGAMTILAPINTAGGAISLAAPQGGNLYVNSALNSGGGAINVTATGGTIYGTASSPFSGSGYSASAASANAGAGTFTATGSNVYWGNMTASGGISLSSTAGSVSIGYATVNFGAGSLDLSAIGGSISAYRVSGTGPVDATAGSSITVSADSGSLFAREVLGGGTVNLSGVGLTVGTVTGSTVYLSAGSGNLSASGSTSRITSTHTSASYGITLTASGRLGSSALPLTVDTNRLDLTTDSTFNIRFPDSPTRTLSYLSMYLDAVGLGTTSTLSGGPVLGSGLSFSSNGSTVTTAFNPTQSLSSLYVDIDNGALTVSSLTNVSTGISLTADGNVTVAAATGTGTSGPGFTANSRDGFLSLGTVSGVRYVYGYADTGISIGSINSSESVNLTAYGGDIVAAADNTAYEITTPTYSSITLTASAGNIGSGGNSLDLKSGYNTTLQASAGRIGTVAKPVNVDGWYGLTLRPGLDFHVVGQDLTATTPTLLSISSIDLSLPASGIGTTSGLKTANFSGLANSTFSPVSDGTTVTLPDLDALPTYMSLSVTGNVGLGNLQSSLSGGSFTLNSTGNIVQASGKSINAAGKTINISANSAVSLNGITAGNADLEANNGGLTTGEITASGNVYLTADHGNLVAGNITTTGSYLHLYAGGTDATINAGNLSSAYRIQTDSTGATTLGIVRAPSYIDLEANSLTLASISSNGTAATTTVNISTSQSFGAANISDATTGLRSTNLTLSSANGIDLVGRPVHAVTASLSGGTGAVRTDLTGTSSLTVSSTSATQGAFGVTTTVPLTTLSVTGTMTGLGGSIISSSSPTLAFTYSGDGLSPSLTWSTAMTPLALNLTLNVSGGDTLNLGTQAAPFSTQGGNLTVTTYGDLDARYVSTLNSASTSSGGNIALYAYGGGDLLVDHLTTTSTRAITLHANDGLIASHIQGGNTTAYAGGSLSFSDVQAGSISLQAGDDITLGNIATTFNASTGGTFSAVSYDASIMQTAGTGLSVGTGGSTGVTLTAQDGSIGTAGSPMSILTSGTLSQLHVNAGGGVNVNIGRLTDGGTVVPADLAQLDVTLFDSSNSVLAINTANLPSGFLSMDTNGNVSIGGGTTTNLTHFSIDNQRGDLSLNGNLGGLQNVTLTTSGNLAVNGNIAVTNYLDLEATHDLTIDATSGARNLSAGYFRVVGDNITFSGGDASGESVSLSGSSGSNSTMSANGNLHLLGNVGGVQVNAGSGALNVSGDDVWLRADSGGASISTTSSLTLTSRDGGSNGLKIEAGQAAASISSGSLNLNAYNGMSLLGGSTSHAAATLSSTGYQNIYVNDGGLQLTAGTVAGASAQILSSGGQTIHAETLTLTGGNDSNARIYNSSGSQTIIVAGGVILNGGGGNSDTSIVHAGSGNQAITADSLEIASRVAGSTGLTGIDSTASGTQTVSVVGDLLIDHAVNSESSLLIRSAGRQEISADTIEVKIRDTNTQSSALATIQAGGDQEVWANASLTVRAFGNGTAEIRSAGNQQSIGAFSFSSSGTAPTGEMVLGDMDATGTSRIISTATTGFQEVIAGHSLYIKAPSGVTSKIDAAGEQAISVVGGGLTVDGGSIDPTSQTIIANGQIELTHASLSATSSIALITTHGDLSVASSSITSGTSLLLTGSVNVELDAQSTLGNGTGQILYGNTLDNHATMHGNFTPTRVSSLIRESANNDDDGNSQATASVISSVLAATIKPQSADESLDASLLSLSLANAGSGLSTFNANMTTGGEEGTFGATGQSNGAADRKDDKKASEQDAADKKDNKPIQNRKLATCS